MKFWLSKNSEVPVRAQLVTQVTLGIASGDLAEGEKLPSTRELARRFDIHQNTVSAAFRELAADGLVEVRKGSGIYVTRQTPGRSGTLDDLIAAFFLQAARLGFSREQARERIAGAAANGPISGFLVVEPNDALREILIAEVTAETGIAAHSLVEAELTQAIPAGFQLTALYDEAEKLRPLLPADTNCIYLKVNSAAASMDGKRRPAEGDLICVTSGWGDFLVFARLFLLAAKIDSDAIATVSTTDPGWRDRLKGVTTIICDTVTARILAGDQRVMPFRLISDTSIDELRRAAGL